MFAAALPTAPGGCAATVGCQMQSRTFFRWIRTASARSPLVSALVLIAASVLKAHALLTIDQPDRSILYSRGLLSCAAALELLLGLALLLRFYPRASLVAARLLFFVFFEVALYLALSGKKVCPCMGVLSLPPWFMAAFDALMVAALMVCDGRAIPARTFHSHPRTFAVACMLYVLISIPALFAMNRHTPEVIKTYARHDGRLRANLKVAYKQVDQQAVLDRIGSETGITLKVDAHVLERQQQFSHLNFSTVPAWVLMEYVARSHEDLRWTKVDNEYHLVPLPFWQRINPWRIAFGILLLELACCVVIYYRFRQVPLGTQV